MAGSVEPDAPRRPDPGRFIRERRASAWAVWFLFLIGYLGFGLAVASGEPPRFGFLAWITVFEIVTTPLIVIVMDRAASMDSSQVLWLSWVFAQLPFLATFMAQFDAAPRWLFVITVLEAAVLMIFAERRASGSADAPGTARSGGLAGG